MLTGAQPGAGRASSPAPINHVVPVVVLATALVTVYNQVGQPCVLRALLDSGSSTTLISERGLRILSTAKRPCQMQVCTVGEAEPQKVSGCVRLDLGGSLENVDGPLGIDALVLNRVVANLPSYAVSVPEDFYSKYSKDEFADPTWNVPGEVDILLGADIYHTIVTGKVMDAMGGLSLISTLFGWAVSGPLAKCFTRHVTVCATQVGDMAKTMEKFWLVEEVPDVRSAENDSSALFQDTVFCKSAEEQFADTYFVENHWTDKEGRIVAPLPFIKDVSLLGSSERSSRLRFLNLERKLEQNPVLHKKYIAVINEFQDMGHLERVPLDELIKPVDTVYHVPHHPVFKEESTTTKIRIVFDASAATSTGVSLNDVLAAGPKLQDDLIHILCRFRFRKVAVLGDVAKMYRQVCLDPKGKDYHRIQWREHSSLPLEIWRMTRVTYGVKSASHAAIKALQVVLDKHGNVLIRLAGRDFYVDDLISGCDSEEDAVALIKGICEALLLGGFELRKMASNVPAVVNWLPDNMKENADAFEFSDETHAIKTLGVNWECLHDQFGFKVKHLDHEPESSKDVKRSERVLNKQRKDKELGIIPTSVANKTPAGYTKRQILSDIAKIFDPLGLIACCVVVLKISMQIIWNCKGKDQKPVTWDEVLPDEVVAPYLEWRTSLVLLRECKIPRRVLQFNDYSKLELHVFCDASSKAYGAVVYVRQVCSEGVSVNMLTSKCKVAPIKVVSIPKLELCAALVGIRLLQTVQFALRHTIFKPAVFCWTDSTTVLQWLACPAGRWQVFVCNRVQAIQHVVDRPGWFHVPTDLNPADLVSRGISVQEMLDSKMWWVGPDFLQEFELVIPRQPTEEDSSEVISEEKKTAIIANAVAVEGCGSVTNLVNPEDFSCLDTLLVRLIFVRRCCNVFKSFSKKLVSKFPRVGTKFACSSRVTRAERRWALNAFTVAAQEEEFVVELKCLRNVPKSQLPKSNRLVKLYPFVDEEDRVLRVGGRLQARAGSLAEETLYPAILPKKCRLANLLACQTHSRTLHGGLQLCMGELRRSFWVISSRQLFRKIISDCTTCYRYNSRPQHPLMGDLPAERITPSDPFTHTGLDFAGPLRVRVKKCIEKAYLAIFVCFTTKAVHIEVVENLTTYGCISAITRFVARKGCPKRIYSDNGTNFTGARAEFLRLRELLDNRVGKVPTLAAKLGMTWVFIPPGSPNFGGLWEAAVKSAKGHLKKVVGKNVLTTEELRTLCCDIEGILNSRPLVPMSDDPNDLTALTPFTLITGGQVHSRQLPILDHKKLPIVNLEKVSYTERLKYVRCMTVAFWKRWSTEYITTLQQRKKDNLEVPNLKKNDMVLLTDERLAPVQWPLGRIIEVFPGNDGQVRTVRVRTAKGEYNKVAYKARKLPIEVAEEPASAQMPK